MDPLSVSLGVMASLQVACSVLTFCYDLRATMRRIPWSLIQVIEEVRDLRNLIEAISTVLDKKHRCSGKTEWIGVEDLDELPMSDNITSVLATCLEELRFLESRVRPEHVQDALESRHKAFVQSLSWRMKDNETKESIVRLQRCKTALSLAISASNSIIIQNIEHLVISLDSKIDSSSQHLNTIKDDLTTSLIEVERKNILNWLSPLSPGQEHIDAHTAHKPKTSEWFLKGADYGKWLNAGNQFLWLTGPPGSGKTVLMSRAIESFARGLDSNKHDTIYAFAYCNFRDPNTQNPVNILGALLAQLCAQVERFPIELLRAYERGAERNQGAPPAPSMIFEAIRILSAARNVRIFVDALDEVNDPKSLARQLMHLTTISSTISVFSTSRRIMGIERVLKDVNHVLMEDHIPEIDNDIRTVITDHILEDSDLDWLSSELQETVTSSLLSKSQGMFRWATYQLNSLGNCRTVRDIKLCLESLPTGLDETYERILATICPSDVPLVQRMLMWLAISAVPITLPQLWEALAIEKGKDHIDNEARLRSPQDILALGKGLVVISSDGSIALAHLSVRDYLESPKIRQNDMTARFALHCGVGHRELAEHCLTYLLSSHLTSGPSNSQEEYLARLKQFPLLSYASRYWFYHSGLAESDEKLQLLITRFFSPETRPSFMSWVQVLNADVPFKWDIYPQHATSLYYASSLGLEDSVNSLLHLGVSDISSPGSRFGGTALHAATIRDHVSVVKKLLDAGAEPGKPDFNGVTPLHSAASQGSLHVVRLLLEYGAPTDARDGMEGRTPYEWARLSCQDEVAELIEHGVTGSGLYDEGPPTTADSRKTQQATGIWQPKAGYFPSYYEHRSGMDSSAILRIEIGKEVLHSDGEYSPLTDGGPSSPVW